jgi:hypothetical protein
MTPMDDKDDLEDGTDPATERACLIIEDVLLAQQTALEIFTNICCDETSGEWEDAESVSTGGPRYSRTFYLQSCLFILVKSGQNDYGWTPLYARDRDQKIRLAYNKTKDTYILGDRFFKNQPKRKMTSFLSGTFGWFLNFQTKLLYRSSQIVLLFCKLIYSK